jgi:hypothetical protein
MIVKFFKKRWTIPILILIGIVADLCFLKEPTQFIHLVVIPLLIVVIWRENIDHSLLFHISAGFFLLVFVRLIFKMDLIVTEKMAVWFLIFSFAAAIRRILFMRSVKDTPDAL